MPGFLSQAPKMSLYCKITEIRNVLPVRCSMTGGPYAGMSSINIWTTRSSFRMMRS